MATKLYLRGIGLGNAPLVSLGQKFNGQGGVAQWWIPRSLIGTAGTSALTASTASANGPTNGIEARSLGAVHFISDPLAAAVTISGTITFNLWGSESSMSANAALACRIDKVSYADFSLTTISTSVDDVELGTSLAAMSWTTTPTSTAFVKGDRIRAVVFFDDFGTMAMGYTLTLSYAHDVSNAADSWIQFNEDLTFAGAFSGVTQVFPIDTASDVATADVDKKAWTTRGT